MPNYPGTANSTTQQVYSTAIPSPTVLFQGQSGLFFSAEHPAAPQASIPFNIGYSPTGVSSRFFSVEIFFAADPGAFELDIQDSDTDADGLYQDVSGGAINAVNSNFAARVELQIKGKFVRMLIKTRTNDVALTAKVTA